VFFKKILLVQITTINCVIIAIIEKGDTMEKGIIVGANTNQLDDIFIKELEELKNLCEACEIEILDTITQNIKSINPKYYIGTGKVKELKELAAYHNVDCIIFNDELSPMQILNIEKATDKDIYDRTYIILEIFNRRARTREAKLQVEIATLSYLLPRLAGLKRNLSRQAGSSGVLKSRGSGETLKEIEKRNINDRIIALKKELKQIIKARKTQRINRKKNNIKVVALVGYTNSGKSSTLNALLEHSNSLKEVAEKNKVFTTLDTSTRLIKLENYHVLVTDTVGFVKHLPKFLLDSFKSTLEEIKEADLILHLVDSTSTLYKQEIEVTNNILKDLVDKDIPKIYVFNKIDLIKEHFFIEDTYENIIRFSAKTKTNLNHLIKLMEDKLFEDMYLIENTFSYNNVKIVDDLITNYEILEISYRDEGIYIKAKVDNKMYNLISESKNEK